MSLNKKVRRRVSDKMKTIDGICKKYPDDRAAYAYSLLIDMIEGEKYALYRHLPLEIKDVLRFRGSEFTKCKCEICTEDSQ